MLLLDDNPQLFPRNNESSPIASAFQKLLSRINSRVYSSSNKRKSLKNSLSNMQQSDMFNVRRHSSSFISKRKYSANSYKHLASKKENPQNQLQNSRSQIESSKQNENSSHKIINISKKGSKSGRYKTEPSLQTQQHIYSKISEYNQLLITKTYMFQEFNNKHQKKEHFRKTDIDKHLGNNLFITNLTAENQKGTQSRIKQSEGRRKYNLFIRGKQKYNKKQLAIKTTYFQPWETDHPEQIIF